MSKATQTKAAGQRRVQLLARPTATVAGILNIDQGRDGTTYWFEPIPSDWGIGAFALTKFGGGGECYHVILDHDGGECDCKGFLRWGRCKHVESCRLLQQRGELSPLPVLPAHSWTPDPFGRCLPDLHEGASYKPGHSSDLPF